MKKTMLYEVAERALRLPTTPAFMVLAVAQVGKSLQVFDMLAGNVIHDGEIHDAEVLFSYISACASPHTGRRPELTDPRRELLNTKDVRDVSPTGKHSDEYRRLRRVAVALDNALFGDADYTAHIAMVDVAVLAIAFEDVGYSVEEVAAAFGRLEPML